jgi:PAS domain S-box-containing protein
MQYTSPSCERITGWKPEDFEKNRGLILALVLEEDRSMVERHAREMHGSGASEMIEFRIRTREGETRWIEHACSAIRDDNGNYEGQRATNRDVTDRKLAQEALLHETRRYADELERRVAERTRQLEIANRELESFSYSVSHDLRAPLRAVDGYTRILMEDYGARLDAEGRRICSVISESAARLGVLIDDLLAFSRLGRVPMQSGLIDMEACARSVFMELTSNKERPRIDFRLDTLPPVYGDRAMLQQVWVNLLSNAVKFSSKRERPEIVVSASRIDGEMEYCVRDNGAGFDMQYADKLFGVFQRLHSVKEFPGTGVGLAIVQRIIARHGGTVRGVGQPEKGAEFFFTLPAGEPS